MLYVTIADRYPECPRPEPVFPDRGWLSQIGSMGLCPHCGHIERRLYPQPVNVVLENPPKKGQPCTLIEKTGITIWHRDFLEVINKFLEGFVLGKCWLSDDTELNEYATCYSSKYVVIRGNRQSRYQMCPYCKTITSQVKPGPQYVLEHDLGRAKIFQDARGRFLLSEEVAAYFNFKGWQVDEESYDYIYLEAVNIRENSADGKPAQLHTVL